MAMILKDEYQDKHGNKYNMMNVNFEKKEDMVNNLGKFVAETEYKNNIFLSTSWNLTNGIYLYQSNFDPEIALRIYKDFANYKYVFHDDEKLVKELLDRKENILLTDFPKGIVTIENYVIGQVISYYKEYETLANVVLKDIDELKIIKYYLDIIRILKELYDNEIVYADVRARNFMINEINNLVKLIDFESKYISFDKKRFHNDMINNLKNMINEINNYLKIDLKLEKEDSLDSIENEILELKHKKS